MSHYQKRLALRSQAKTLQKITPQIQAVIAESQIQTGLCTLFLRHTSASLIIQENADPDVLADLERFMARLVPEADRYLHSTEGPDDMPAHIRTVLTQNSIPIPIDRGRLVLGTWQGIYLWEHRQMSHTRELVVHISGD